MVSTKNCKKPAVNTVKARTPAPKKETVKPAKKVVVAKQYFVAMAILISKCKGGYVVRFEDPAVPSITVESKGKARNTACLALRSHIGALSRPKQRAFEAAWLWSAVPKAITSFTQEDLAGNASIELAVANINDIRKK